jgi:hypothetical protein
MQKRKTNSWADRANERIKQQAEKKATLRDSVKLSKQNSMAKEVYMRGGGR